MEVNQAAQNKNDTGSIAYQINSLRVEIKNLQFHLTKNKSADRKGNEKDIPAKRSLLKKVAKLRRFLEYLRKNNPNLYEQLKFTKNQKVV